MSTPNPVEELLRQAYRVAAHQHAADNNLQIGDFVRVHNYLSVNSGSGNPATDRMGATAPLGCGLRTVSDRPYYEGNAIFRGINAAGDFMVRAGKTDYPMPYSYVRALNKANAEKSRATLKMNDSYSATVLGDTSVVAVGCQRFKVSKLRELLALVDAEKVKFDAEAAAVAAKPAIVLNPVATYVPTVVAPKKAAPKKVAAKKPAAKKVAAKKPAAKKPAAKRVRT